MPCKTCGGLRKIFDMTKVNPRADMTPGEIGAELERVIVDCPDCVRPAKPDCCDGLTCQPEKKPHG